MKGVPCPRCNKALTALSPTNFTCSCGFNLRLDPNKP